jgi:DNA helicase HerA-like ATPase
MPQPGHDLRLGRTLTGQNFYIEGQDLEKVNVVTGVKGSGKSHLAKVILLQLIEQGAPCIVFDINREYIHLPKAEVDEQTGHVLRRGIVHLEAGGNFRLGVSNLACPR